MHISSVAYLGRNCIILKWHSLFRNPLILKILLKYHDISSYYLYTNGVLIRKEDRHDNPGTAAIYG
jgi:hypothetical protein